MEKNNGNFNFEEYQKKHEGILQRIWRKLDKLKWLKPIFTLAFLGILIAAIGVVKQFYTTDAGKVIDGLYRETLNGINETRQLMAYVQLPDSIENQQEVQRLRAFQNRIYAYDLLYLSIAKEPKFYDDAKKTKSQQQDEQKNLIGHWIQSLMFLGNRNSEIIEEFKAIANHLAEKEDSLALRSVNFFMLTEVLHFQEEFNVLLSETSNKMSIENNKKSVDGAINVTRELLTDKKLYANYQSLHRAHIMFLNVTNLRLITIRNKEIDKNFGRYRNEREKLIPVFTPSFLNR